MLSILLFVFAQVSTAVSAATLVTVWIFYGTHNSVTSKLESYQPIFILWTIFSVLCLWWSLTGLFKQKI